MPDLIIIGSSNGKLAELQTALSRKGFSCSLTAYNEDIAEFISDQSPDVVIAEITGHQTGNTSREYIQEIKIRTSLPIVGLVAETILDDLDVDQSIDDFISTPYNISELVLRIKRILKREVAPEHHETISCEGLLIDLASCEVSVAGKKVELTFKEYELLKFLAGNSGRVFTREALLDKIWGMDYFGGDRTVDVHIRRLRSKIEKHGQSFIETVRNIGYRFRKGEE
jgi:DNA-binding response OmpR family regulator